MAKTAQQIVTRTRQLLQLVEGLNVRYRDGWTSDPNQDLTPILPTVNEFLSVASLTGIKAEDVNVTAIVNQRDYPFAAGIARIISVYYNGTALRQTTRQALDQMEPSWLNLHGTPTRYFREGNKIILDKYPDVNSTMVIRSGMSLTIFDGSSTVATLDSAIPDTAAERIAYGVAYMQIFVDAEDLVHGRRVQSYKAMGDGVLQELGEASDTVDYASPVSLDEWVGPMKKPLPSSEDYLHYKSQQTQ